MVQNVSHETTINKIPLTMGEAGDEERRKREKISIAEDYCDEYAREARKLPVL